MIPLIFVVELMSFLVRPFSLGLRLFVAMTAGHILLKVLSGFVINSTNAGIGYGVAIGLPTFALMIGITAPEILVELGRASGRERVCQYGSISVVAVSLKKKTKNT